MAQSRRSRTVVLPNGNRVTVTVGGSGRNGFYKTVSVRRTDGTGESKTDRRNGSSIFNPLGGPYDDSIPAWAQSHGSGAPNTLAPGRATFTVSAKAKVIVFLVIGAVVLLVWGVRQLTRTSYGDGRNWALRWEYGFAGVEPFPGCKQSYMMSSGYVDTPQAGVFSKRVYGAGEPGDNYAQWKAGCLSAEAVYQHDSQSGG